MSQVSMIKIIILFYFIFNCKLFIYFFYFAFSLWCLQACLFTTCYLLTHMQVRLLVYTLPFSSTYIDYQLLKICWQVLFYKTYALNHLTYRDIRLVILYLNVPAIFNIRLSINHTYIFNTVLFLKRFIHRFKPVNFSIRSRLKKLQLFQTAFLIYLRPLLAFFIIPQIQLDLLQTCFSIRFFLASMLSDRSKYQTFS